MREFDVCQWVEVKEVRDDGTFSGVASVYGVEDLGNDIIEKGAFKKTIAENPEVPILWQHDSSEVIGSGQVSESGSKIMLSGRLDLDDPTAAKAYRKLKSKLIKGLSIGFQAIKSVWEEIEEEGQKRYVRRIQELKLWEVSVVTFPMLPLAQVTRVKSADEYEQRIARLEDEIKALQATKATPATEPAPAAEPPQQPTEPVIDHSLVSSILNSFKGE